MSNRGIWEKARKLFRFFIKGSLSLLGVYGIGLAIGHEGETALQDFATINGWLSIVTLSAIVYVLNMHFPELLSRLAIVASVAMIILVWFRSTVRKAERVWRAYFTDID